MKSKLEGAAALGDGSDLWVLPSRSLSRWARHIDWLCNLQILKFEKKPPRELSIELQNIIKDEELELQQPKLAQGAPLLIQSLSFLPTKHVLVLNSDMQENETALSLADTVESLGARNVRMFFLKTSHREAFEKNFKKIKGTSEVMRDMTWTSDEHFLPRSV